MTTSYGTLTLHMPHQETAVVELTVSEVVLGRSRQATVRLNDDLISKLHLRVIVRSDGVWLEDLDATNGTFVDGELIPPHQQVQIQPGQSVQLGDTVFQYVPPRVALAQTPDAMEFEVLPATTLHEKHVPHDPAWRKPLMVAVSVLMLLLLCGIVTFSLWWFSGGRDTAEEMPPAGVPMSGEVTIEACQELTMTAVSPELAAYRQVPFLDLPFAYGEGAAAFRQAVQQTQAGGRINGFFDHLYPLYPSPGLGREPVKPLIGGNILLFTGQLNDQDHFSGHPGYDFAPEDARQATTAVLAAADGFIQDVGIDEESGAYYVKLIHTVADIGDFQTIYWHLQPDSYFDDTEGRIGERVTSGTRLGTMGSSGWGPGIQLHFEVRFDGDGNGRFTLDEAIDPFGYLPNPAYPQDPWSQDFEIADGRSEIYKHNGQARFYLWRYTNGTLGQVGENGGGLILGQVDTGLNQVTLCAPAGSLPPASSVVLAWAPDPVVVPEHMGVGLGCVLNVADNQGEQLTQFAQPVRLELPLAAADLSQVNPETLALYWQDPTDASWQPLPTFIDESKQIAAAEINRPGACALLAEPLADNMPPRSSIEVNGEESVDGTWFDAVTVSIQSDEDTDQIEFSLDAGITWQPYTGPFILEAEDVSQPLPAEPREDFGSDPGRFLVLAAATDHEGNRENPPAFRHIIVSSSQGSTVVEEPTPTHTPSSDSSCQPEITVDASFGVNVRRGPGLEYGIVTSLPQGANAPVIGRNRPGSWWKLDLDVGTSREYWVAADVVKETCVEDVPVVPTPPPPTATPTATPTMTPTPTPTATPTMTPTGDPDIEPPEVSIAHTPLLPTSEDQMVFVAQAEDDTAVARIEIWVRAPSESSLIRRMVCEDVTVCVYDAGSYQTGEGDYQAFAWDMADNQGVTAVLPFTVESPAYP